jgi:hypothetical protein
MFAYTREEDLARDKRDGRMCAGGSTWAASPAHGNPARMVPEQIGVAALLICLRPANNDLEPSSVSSRSATSSATSSDRRNAPAKPNSNTRDRGCP